VPLYQPMYSTMARRAAARVGHWRVSSSSPLIEAKNDSARALSQHWPAQPVDSVTSHSPTSAANSPEVYCAAAVGMEDHSRARVAGGDGVGQRGGGQPGAQVIGEGEADDPAGGDVNHGGDRYSHPSHVAM
jgi:hypothetical protein